MANPVNAAAEQVQHPVFEYKGPNFFSTFGTHPFIYSTEADVKEYNTFALLNMRMNEEGNNIVGSSFLGFQRMGNVVTQIKAGCPEPNKCWLVSQCVRGLFEFFNIGDCICPIPDYIATECRKNNGNPTGSMLYKRVTNAPAKPSDFNIQRE